VHIAGPARVYNTKLCIAEAQALALIDEVRMDRSLISVVRTGTPSDSKEYWKTWTMEERLAALELTRQILNDYDPDTTRFSKSS
jgi:hypothetical protein